MGTVMRNSVFTVSGADGIGGDGGRDELEGEIREMNQYDVSGSGQCLFQLGVKRSPDDVVSDFEKLIVHQTGMEKPEIMLEQLWAKESTLSQHSSLVCATRVTLDPLAGIVLHIQAVGRD